MIALITVVSFDGSVSMPDGAQKERPRDCQPERFRDLEIDDQFELGRLRHRQVSGIGRVENAPDISSRHAKRLKAGGVRT